LEFLPVIIGSFLGGFLWACIFVFIQKKRQKLQLNTPNNYAWARIPFINNKHKENMTLGFTEKVRQFAEAREGALPSTPCKLNLHEVDSVCNLAGAALTELEEATNTIDQVDAMASVVYSIFDSAARQGINLDPILDIVHNANMQLIVDGQVLHHENSNIKCPDGWVDPEPLIVSELGKQQVDGAFPKRQLEKRLIMQATPPQIKKTFTEWERRYREEPDKFQSDNDRLGESSEDYGDAAAPYFLEILREIQIDEM